MDQNLSGYKIFYEVASCGNISKAAKKLYISQPAISKSIVKLEDGLDTKLFHRNSRGVTLTEEGQLLYKYIKDAFDNINNAEVELKRMKEFNIGHIQIGVSNTLCRYILLPYLQKFMEKFPNIRVSVNTQATAQTLNLIEAKKIDVGLTAEPKSRRPEIRFVHSRQIHDVFVATPQYLENLRSICGPDFNVFEEANLMLLDQNNMTRRHIDDYFKAMNIEPSQILEVTTMDLLIEFAKIGIGVSCVVRELVQKEIDAGTLVELPLQLPIPSRNIGFVYNTGNTSKSLDAFLSVLE
ncbi:transcriptional regulator [Lachnospiraceae bacterium JC7]|nr:transcriptional regulator [Lachnospiraceae bacterium JC7]